MSVNEVNLPLAPEAALLSTPTLGALGMICAPALYLASLFYLPDGQQSNPNQIYASFLGIIYLCGALASATAVRRLRLTGKGAGGAILYGVQVVGLLLAMTFDVLEYAAPQLRETAIFFITDMAYPFSHIMFLIAGIAIVRAHIWHGWRLIPAFLIGSALPSFIALSGLFGRENSGFVFPVFATCGFFLLGYAARTTKQNKTIIS